MPEPVRWEMKDHTRAKHRVLRSYLDQWIPIMGRQALRARATRGCLLYTSEDWWTVHSEHTTAILAVRRVDVRALNEMVRGHRKASGELGEDIRIGDKTFSVGDRVIFEQNQRVREPGSEAGAATVRIRNGTFATVVGVTDSASPGEQRAATRAVSYTHLDVYKRQG